MKSYVYPDAHRNRLVNIQPGEITELEALDLAAAAQRSYDTTGSMSKLLASTVNSEPARDIGFRKLASANGGSPT